MNTSSIASDLSYFVLQKRRERQELGACALDSSNQRLYPLPSQLVVREAFIADRIVGVSDREWNARKRQSQLS